MDAPFDRGEIDRSSLDATERLRARLSGRPVASAAPRRASVAPWVIAGSLVVFTAGMIANPWFESNVRGYLPFAKTATVETNLTEIQTLRDRLARLETPVAGSMPVERLARTEAKIENSSDQIARESDRVDRLTSQVAALDATLRSDRARAESATATAIAAAERARAMLTLVLVGRAVENGRPLGGLDPALRQSFEFRYPAAVKSVAALGSLPVTLASLRRDFDAMRPAIGGRPAAGAKLNWWDALTSKLSIPVSTAPAIDGPETAAEAALQRGDYLAAVRQLRRLPTPRPAALNNWLAAAGRLQAGRLGLAVLENGTLLPMLPSSSLPTALAPPTMEAPAAQRAPAPNGAQTSDRADVFAPVAAEFRRTLSYPPRARPAPFAAA